MRCFAIRSTLALVALGGACDEPVREFDSFPVAIELRAGAVFVGASHGDSPMEAVTVDTMSPISAIDTSSSVAGVPRRLATDLTIYSAGGTPRMTFNSAEVFDLHPCDNGGPFAPCAVGLDADVSELRGVIGTNLLARQSVRFDFAASSLRFFPDIAGTNNDRSELCEALFDGPFSGGGTLVVADGEVNYVGNRPAVGACLDTASPIIPGEVTRERGADSLLVISTGIGPSILAESAYNRYADAVGAPRADALADAVLHLPSGPVGAKRGELGHITLVGEVGTDSANRGPCRELYANRVMAGDLCLAGAVSDCPCKSGNFCRAGSALLLAGPFAVAVVADENAMLQALRVELRPGFAEVDGILGASALVSTRLDFDYSNVRIVGRCSDPATCSARPQVSRRADLAEVTACLAR